MCILIVIKRHLIPVGPGNAVERAVINLQPVEGERSPAQFKPTSLDCGWLEPATRSCPGLLRPRDGTVEKNKGTVAMISHTPPTSPPPHPEIRTRRRFSKVAFLVNSGLVFGAVRVGVQETT